MCKTEQKPKLVNKDTRTQKYCRIQLLAQMSVIQHTFIAMQFPKKYDIHGCKNVHGQIGQH